MKKRHERFSLFSVSLHFFGGEGIDSAGLCFLFSCIYKALMRTFHQKFEHAFSPAIPFAP